MMKKRVLSALILCIILIPLVIIGGIPFRIAVGIIGILAYKEVLELKGLKKYPVVVVLIGLASLLTLVYSNREISFSTIGLDYRYLAGIFLAMFLPTVFYYETDKYTAKDAFKLTSFTMFLGIVLNLLSNILIYDKRYFFLILIVTICTDIFAYLVGMMIGIHKVTKISPKKSLEGYIGGAVMGTVLSSIYYMTFIGEASWLNVMFALAVMSIACELGDLFYSLIKREEGIKDFSNLIPGHGGVLDRIDSLTIVTLVYVLLRGLI